VRRPQELVFFTRLETSGRLHEFPYRLFDPMRPQPAVFTDVAASWLIDRYNVATTSGLEGQMSERVPIMLASGNYFSTLGVTAGVGRVLAVDDDRAAGANPVAVISDSFWKRRFARASDVAGRTLTIQGTPFTIVGVTPKAFTGEWAGSPADVWVPF